MENTSSLKRAQIMFHYKDLLEKNTDTIALLVAKEHGKTIDDAKGELQRGIEVVELAYVTPELFKGEYSKNVANGIDGAEQQGAKIVVDGRHAKIEEYEMVILLEQR